MAYPQDGLDNAMATIDEEGTPVIYFDPEFIGGFSQATQRFITAHECAHHALGHTVGEEVESREQDADCYAIRQLFASGQFGEKDLKQLQKEMRNFGGGGPYLPGPARGRALTQCLREEGQESPPPAGEVAAPAPEPEPEEAEEAEPGWPWTRSAPAGDEEVTEEAPAPPRRGRARGHDHQGHEGCWTPQPSAETRPLEGQPERASSTQAPGRRRGWERVPRREPSRELAPPLPATETERTMYWQVCVCDPQVGCRCERADVGPVPLPGFGRGGGRRVLRR